MITINIPQILNTVYGVRGLPFPGKSNIETVSPVAGDFTAPVQSVKQRSQKGTPLWGQNLLGRPVFLPAMLAGVDLPNPLISISGEKSIVETDIVDVGTVFEKVFTKPYYITIICTLISEDGSWPEDQLISMYNLWKKDDVLTLECALTDIYLQPKNNFILTNKDLLDMQGVENVQVIQYTGKSNIDFELEIV
jgi:hypothetical protein